MGREGSGTAAVWPRAARRTRRASLTVLGTEYLADLIVEPLIAALRVLPESRERHDDPYEEGDDLEERPDQGDACVIQAGSLEGVGLDQTVVAEYGAKSHEEGLDVADHLAGRVHIDQSPLPVQPVHFFFDLQW